MSIESPRLQGKAELDRRGLRPIPPELVGPAAAAVRKFDALRGNPSGEGTGALFVGVHAPERGDLPPGTEGFILDIVVLPQPFADGGPLPDEAQRVSVGGLANAGPGGGTYSLPFVQLMKGSDFQQLVPLAVEVIAAAQAAEE